MNRRLQVLAIFDKPDPLDGPFFEETIYLTPSSIPAGLRARSGLRGARQSARSASSMDRCTPSCATTTVDRGSSIGRPAYRRPVLGGAPLWRHGISLEEIILRLALGMPVRRCSANGWRQA